MAIVQVFDTPKFIKSVVHLKTKKMKKLIYGTLFLAIVGIGFVGCKKENNRINSNLTNNDFSTNGKMLIFESVESYEKSIELQSAEKREKFLSDISKLNFKNYFSVEHTESKSGNDSVQEMDEFLGQLLNEDGIIQIGDYIYKVNLQSEKVFVLPAANIVEYQDLVNENLSNKNIRRYSVGDDVIYLAESGDSGEKCGGIGGGDYVSDVVDFGNNRRCQAMVRHFRAGVYYRTTARFVPLISGVIDTDLEVMGPEAWRNRRPCDSDNIGRSAAGVKASGTTEQLWQFYVGTRNLNGFYLFARIKCKSNGQVKYSTWCGRNINSPY